MDRNQRETQKGVRNYIGNERESAEKITKRKKKKKWGESKQTCIEEVENKSCERERERVDLENYNEKMECKCKQRKTRNNRWKN